MKKLLLGFLAIVLCSAPSMAKLGGMGNGTPLSHSGNSKSGAMPSPAVKWLHSLCRIKAGVGMPLCSHSPALHDMLTPAWMLDRQSSLIAAGESMAPEVSSDLFPDRLNGTPLPVVFGQAKTPRASEYTCPCHPQFCDGRPGRADFAHQFCTVDADPKEGGQSPTYGVPAGVDEKLWTLMQEIDANGAKISDLKADFVQEKFTPLLKKPLVSSGTILIKGSAALWKTLHPSPTVLRIDPKEARLLYPDQKVLEVYAVDQQMGSLAASPFPRLEVTKKYFTFERIAVKELSKEVDEAKHLALRMKPIEPELRKHLDEVSVLLEISSGLVLRAQTIDADGDRTVMTFSNIKTNSGLKESDLEMDVPPGVKVTHPLEAVGGAPPVSREKGK